MPEGNDNQTVVPLPNSNWISLLPPLLARHDFRPQPQPTPHLARVVGPHARPELDAMTRSGSVRGLGSSCSPVGGAEGDGQAVIF